MDWQRMETWTMNRDRSAAHGTPTLRTTGGTSRKGFTLIEVMIALTILVGVVLAMGMSTTTLSRSVRDSDVRNRAQSVADMQIGRARAWPTYATLLQLTEQKFNGTVDGLTSTTTVTVDTTSGQNITKVKVTVSAVATALLSTPISRTISIAAP